MGTASQTEPARALGKYSLMEKLGEGSLGPVYRGFDQEADRAVVIRILSNGIKWDTQAEEHFIRECGSMAGLQHPNIAAVYEIGKEEKSPYIVTESLGSNCLENLIAQKPAMTVESKLSIMIRIANALDHAHKHGALHGNLAPSKIHLTPDGSLKVRDFAIGQALGDRLPSSGASRDAILYMSPEQMAYKSGDARSDVFSAGTIFYELLTYSHPFKDQNGGRAADSAQRDEELPTFERFPDEPPGIWPILRTCLARDPKDRYQSMEEVVKACRELLTDVAEDTRFMLAELHASFDPLRKAAARVDASMGTIKLLQEVTKFLDGDEHADYVSLDRLMTGLIEQYPLIREAAGDVQKLESERLQLPALESAVDGSGASIREPVAAMDDTFVVPAHGADSVDEQRVPPLPAPAPEAEGLTPVSHDAAASQPQYIPETSTGEPEEGRLAVAAVSLEGTPQPEQPLQASTACEEPSVAEESAAPQDFRWIFRFAVASLSILIMAVAVFIALEIGTSASARRSTGSGVPKARTAVKGTVGSQTAGSGPVPIAEARGSSGRNSVAILLDEARTLVGMNRLEEGKVLLRRILEIDPECEEAVTALKEIDGFSGGNLEGGADRALQRQLARLSNMISSGKLASARTELDRLQKAFPNSPEIKAVRKRYEAREAQEQARRDEELRRVMQKQKEDEWNRKLSQLFALGKYDEAGSAASGWLAEDPGNSRARDYSGRIQEIQRNLRTYAAASSDNRYQEALNALGNAEKLNPEDPGFAELRRQIEARKAAAKATLTIYRLGSKGVLLLDGKPIGSDGEVVSEAITIGSHTLAIESDGRTLMSRSQEYLEGQGVVLVYDLARQHLRPLAETDRELLAQRKAREAVHRFALEHTHGRLRGSCSGVLVLSSSEVAFNPFKGTHGFRLPFSNLQIRGEGKSIDLLLAPGNTQVHSFKFSDVQAADRFRQTWNELKALSR